MDLWEAAIVTGGKGAIRSASHQVACSFMCRELTNLSHVNNMNMIEKCFGLNAPIRRENGSAALVMSGVNTDVTSGVEKQWMDAVLWNANLCVIVGATLSYIIISAKWTRLEWMGDTVRIVWFIGVPLRSVPLKWWFSLELVFVCTIAVSSKENYGVTSAPVMTLEIDWLRLLWHMESLRA